MNPKKCDPVYDLMVAEFGIPPDFAKALVKFYYKIVRKELAEINTGRLELRGLGSFDLKYYKVKYKLRDNTNFITYHEKQRTNKAISILINLERKRVVLKRAQEIADKRVKDMAIKKQARAEYVAKIFKNMEEPGQDPGGDKV